MDSCMLTINEMNRALGHLCAHIGYVNNKGITVHACVTSFQTITKKQKKKQKIALYSYNPAYVSKIYTKIIYWTP